jgi:hypothetical protein
MPSDMYDETQSIATYALCPDGKNYDAYYKQSDEYKLSQLVLLKYGR